MACNESSDFQQTISHALQRLATPSMVLQTFNSPLALRTHEIRRHCSTLYPTERLSLMLVFPASLFFYQTMLLYGGYKPQRIHKGGKPMLFSLTGPRRDIYYLNFVRAHTPKQGKRHKREQRHF